MTVWMEMLTGRRKCKYPAARVLPYVGFALLFLLFFWRAFLGFDWSDESAYYAAPYRLLLGDRPLVDSWDSHPGWSLLATPFLWLYGQWKGSMDGLLLAGRLCFLVVQTGTAVFTYRRLLALCRSHLAAMLAGWLTAAFVPGMIFNFSYESVGLFAMVLSCVTLVWQYRREAARIGLASLEAGLLAGLAGVVYPAFLLGVIPMGVALALYRPGEKKKGVRSLAPLFLFLTGMLLPLAVEIVILGQWIGWPVLAREFPWLITSRSCPFSGYWNGVFTFFMRYSRADSSYLVEFSLLALLLLIKRIHLPLDLPFRIEDIFYSIVKIALPVCILANVVLIVAQPNWDMPANVKMTQLLASAGLWPVILCLQNPTRRSKILLWGMYLPGQLMAFGAHLTDRPSDFGAAFALLPSMLAAVLIVYENYGPLLRSINRGSMEVVVAVIRTCMAMVALFLLGTTIVIRSGLSYRDLPVSELHTQLTSGPAQGIYTTEIDAQAYESMVQEIRETQEGCRRVLILGNLPFGYLCSDLPVASPMVSQVPVDSSYLYDYLAENLERRPDWIYVPNPLYGYGNEDNAFSVKEVQWIAGGELEMQESVYSTVYTLAGEEEN